MGEGVSKFIPSLSDTRNIHYDAFGSKNLTRFHFNQQHDNWNRNIFFVVKFLYLCIQHQYKPLNNVSFLCYISSSQC